MKTDIIYKDEKPSRISQLLAHPTTDETLAKAAEIGVTRHYIYSLVDRLYERIHAGGTFHGSRQSNRQQLKTRHVWHSGLSRAKI